MPVGEAESHPCPLRLLRRMIPHAEGTHEAPRGSPLTAGCDHVTGADEVEVRQSLPGLWYDQGASLQSDVCSDHCGQVVTALQEMRLMS